MGNPITWQTVQGPSLADAARPLDSASNSFSTMFSGLQNILKERQAVEAANWANTKTNNTNADMNALMQFGTPEEYAAAQKSGAIASIIGRNGAQVDQQALRNAADSRLGTLQQRAKAGFEYQNAALDQAQAGDRDRISSMLASDDPAQHAAAKQELARLTLRNEAVLHQAASEATQRLVGQGRSTTEFGWKGEKHTQDILKSNADIQNNKGQLAVSQRQAAVSEGNLKINQAEQLDRREKNFSDRLAKNREELGALAETSASSAAGSKKIFEAINIIGDKDTKENARILAAKLIATPGMTTGAAMSAVSGIPTSNMYTWDSTQRNKAVNAAEDIMLSPGSASAEENKALATKSLYDEQKTLKAKLKILESGGIQSPINDTNTSSDQTNKYGSRDLRKITNPNFNRNAVFNDPITMEDMKGNPDTKDYMRGKPQVDDTSPDTSSFLAKNPDIANSIKAAANKKEASATAAKKLVEAARATDAISRSEIKGITPSDVEAMDAGQAARILSKYDKVLPLDMREALFYKINKETGNMNSAW